MQNCDLTVKIGKMILKNPVIVSSGTFGFGEEFEDFFDLNQSGRYHPKRNFIKTHDGKSSTSNF